MTTTTTTTTTTNTKLTSAEVCRYLVAHVASGGWLGASWPVYTLPRGRVTQAGLDAGYELAMCQVLPNGRDVRLQAHLNWLEASGGA
jgi:hypothetical protein